MGRGQELGFAFPASDHPLPPHSTEEFPGRGGACAGRHVLRGFSPSSRPMLPFFPPEGLLSPGEKAFKRLAWTGLKGKIYYPRGAMCGAGHVALAIQNTRQARPWTTIMPLSYPPSRPSSWSAVGT